MVEKNTSPVKRWNIFARELEDILNARGFQLSHLDDRTFIHREKVRRLRRSLKEPKSFPVLNPFEMEAVIDTFQFSDLEVLRLRTALFTAAIEEQLMDRIHAEDALQTAERLFPILLQSLEKEPVLEIQHVSGANSDRVRWNIFARELEDILSTRGLRLTHLDDRASLHREKVRRLIRSLHSPKSFPVLSPEEMDGITTIFGLSEAEEVRLRAALFATSIEEMLMDRIYAEDALQTAEQLLPILTQGLITLGAIPSAIREWLVEKGTRTDSERTVATYSNALQQFRTYLHHLGLELNSDPSALAKAAHEWASTPSPRRNQSAPLSPATYNQRLSILSSFYQYICDQKRYIGAHFFSNPVDMVPRASIQENEGIPLLDQEVVKKRLAHIDRSTSQGKRDYALLCVILTANCRASEVAGLRYSHVEWEGTHVAIIWAGRRQAEKASTVLVPAAAQALKEYLYSIYGDAKIDDTPDDELPIWISFSQRTLHIPFQAISTQTIADICQKYLGVSTISAMRRLFFPKRT